MYSNCSPFCEINWILRAEYGVSHHSSQLPSVRKSCVVARKCALELPLPPLTDCLTQDSMGQLEEGAPTFASSMTAADPDPLSSAPGARIVLSRVSVDRES